MGNAQSEYIILSDYSGTIELSGSFNEPLLNLYSSTAEAFNIQTNIITARHSSEYHGSQKSDSYAVEWYHANLLDQYHLDTKVIYANGIIQLASSGSTLLLSRDLNREDPETYRVIAAFFQTTTDKLAVIDDSLVNIDFAKQAGCLTANSERMGEVTQVFDVIKSKATPRYSIH
jgi:hypothetical protein